jgi:acetolactate synthase-1/3 small subunit
MLPDNSPAHSISLLVSNKPGVLVRISLVFSRRGYNIDSLVVSPTLDGRFSRMNIVARGNPETLAQIILQLEKLVDVLSAIDHTGQSVVENELALFKIKLLNTTERTEILQIADHFRATSVDMTPTSVIVQATGPSDKIDAVKTMLESYKIVEYIRTGKVIMARGEKPT